MKRVFFAKADGDNRRSDEMHAQLTANAPGKRTLLVNPLIGRDFRIGIAVSLR
jgi:hypothetical protein